MIGIAAGHSATGQIAGVRCRGMTAAIFGLLGVVVGGLINIIGGVIAEWRRERNEMRAAARLLADELRGIRGRLTMAASADDYTLRKLDTPEWDRHRDILARWWDRKLWATVSAAYTMANSAAGSEGVMRNTERALAGHAAELAAAAIELLDQRDSRRHARALREDDDRLFEGIAAAGRRQPE